MTKVTSCPYDPQQCEYPRCIEQGSSAFNHRCAEQVAAQDLGTRRCGHSVADRTTDASVECSLPDGHVGGCDYSEAVFSAPQRGLSLYRCKVCGTRWLLWPDGVHGGGWNLLDRWQRPGACCDNVAMGDQIEHLRDLLPTLEPTP